MKKLIGIAVAALLLASAPALAQPPDRGDTPGLGWGKGGSGGGRQVVGVPGPVAGVGLPILAVVGGFVWLRSRKPRDDRRQG